MDRYCCELVIEEVRRLRTNFIEALKSAESNVGLEHAWTPVCPRRAFVSAAGHPANMGRIASAFRRLGFTIRYPSKKNRSA